MLCTLSKRQVNKLIKLYGSKLSGTISNEKQVYVRLSTSGLGEVNVEDILGNSLGKITVKEALAL